MFITNNGKQYDIIGEKGKFYLCDGATFHKASKLGHMEEIAIEVATEAEVVCETDAGAELTDKTEEQDVE